MAVSKRMLTIIRIILFSGTFISLLYVPWILVKMLIMPLPDSIQEQVNEVAAYGFEGIIVYIDQQGQPPALYAAGFKNREQQIPADPNGLFKIASIGKLYDAVAVAKLIAEKKLFPDKTLADYFPELAERIEYADKITLRMMVQHRSGLPNLTSTPDFWNNPPHDSKDAVERILDLPADFEPDSRYEYSNTNYLLIGELIKKVTQADKFEYIKTNILLPLGLQDTYGSIREVDPDRVMSGYYVGVEEDIKMTDYGSMLATAADVGVFLRALNDGSLVEGDEAQIYAGLYEFEHTGLIPGYQSIAWYEKEIDTVIVQFTNTTDFDGYNWNLADIMYWRIVRILKKRRPQNTGDLRLG